PVLVHQRLGDGRLEDLVVFPAVAVDVQDDALELLRRHDVPCRECQHRREKYPDYASHVASFVAVGSLITRETERLKCRMVRAVTPAVLLRHSQDSIGASGILVSTRTLINENGPCPRRISRLVRRPYRRRSFGRVSRTFISLRYRMKTSFHQRPGR